MTEIRTSKDRILSRQIVASVEAQHERHASRAELFLLSAVLLSLAVITLVASGLL